MSKTKDIERVYVEAFRDFEASVPTNSWERLEERLHSRSKKNKRKLWLLPLSGVAASLLGFLFLQVFSSPQPTSSSVSDTTTFKEAYSLRMTPYLGFSNEEVRLTPYEKILPTPVLPSFSKEQDVLFNNHKEILLAYEPSLWLPQEVASVLQPYPVSSNPLRFQENETATSEETLASPTKYSDLREASDALAALDENEERSRRWSLAPQAGPVYYQSLSQGSPINPQFSDNPKSGNLNMSYGLQLSYALGNKVTVRTGINKLNLGYETSGVDFQPVASGSTNSHINFNRPVTLADAGSIKGSAQSASKSVSPGEAALLQQIGYLEMPLEIQYRVGGEKLGVSLIGGVSSLILTDNLIQFKEGGFSSSLGEASNLNIWNLSTNIGLGIDYRFNRQWKLQVEPMFKYQWNTFSEGSGGFSPYILGVNTGFSITF